MAVKLSELQELQELQVQLLKNSLQECIDENLPLDAATHGVIAKLLKDNNVTVDPADNDKLSELRNKLKQQAEARSSVIQMVKSDLKEAAG